MRAKALPERMEAPAGLACRPPLREKQSDTVRPGVMRAEALPERVEAPAGLACPSPFPMPGESPG